MSVIWGRSVVFFGSSTNITDHHDITEISLKVALNPIILPLTVKFVCDMREIGGLLRFPPPIKLICHDITEHHNPNLNPQIFQWLVTGQWVYPVSSTNSNDLHDTIEILLKVALNTIALTITLKFVSDSTNKTDLSRYNCIIVESRVNTITHIHIIINDMNLI